MTAKNELFDHYSKTSKHSNYQVLPEKLASLVGEEVQVVTRHEPERQQFVLEKVDLKNKNVLDIGGNTGYFTFEALEAGARNVHYYEGNKEHAKFVRLAAESLGVSDQVEATNDYFSFDDTSPTYDVVLLFNVLHHVGDDYGQGLSDIQHAKKVMLEQLNNVAYMTRTVVFQMGFNWQGDKTKPLFEHGQKQEMIDFVKSGTAENWDITSIGVAERVNGAIAYHELNDNNIKRDDSLGEFLNRPIFIMQSKVGV